MMHFDKMLFCWYFC